MPADSPQAAASHERPHGPVGIGVNHARWVRSGPRPVITRQRPEVAGFGPATPRIQHRRGGLIDTELRRGGQKLAQTMPQGLQFLGGIADPEGERGTVDGDTVRRQHLRLGVKRQMPMILRVDQMRDQSLGGQSSSDQPLGSGVLENDTVTGAAGQFGPAGDDHSDIAPGKRRRASDSLIRDQSRRDRLLQHGQQVAAGIRVSDYRCAANAPAAETTIGPARGSSLSRKALGLARSSAASRAATASSISLQNKL